MIAQNSSLCTTTDQPRSKKETKGVGVERGCSLGHAPDLNKKMDIQLKILVLKRDYRWKAAVYPIKKFNRSSYWTYASLHVTTRRIQTKEYSSLQLSSVKRRHRHARRSTPAECGHVTAHPGGGNATRLCCAETNALRKDALLSGQLRRVYWR